MFGFVKISPEEKHIETMGLLHQRLPSHEAEYVKFTNSLKLAKSGSQKLANCDLHLSFYWFLLVPDRPHPIAAPASPEMCVERSAQLSLWELCGGKFP